MLGWDIFFDSFQTQLGVCGIYVNSSIMDEGALIETSPLQDRGLIHSNWSPLDHLRVFDAIFGGQNCQKYLIAYYKRVRCVFHLANGQLYIDTTNH